MRIDIITVLPELLESPDGWDSLVINRRKPVTHRVHRNIGDIRVCLHYFEECLPSEAFEHPHPWPAAFAIMSGSYLMKLGQSSDRHTKPLTMDPTILMVHGSQYEIVDPLTWHSVIPNDKHGVYTIMVNGEPWPPEIAHTEVRTTKGKDLDKLSPQELQRMLSIFKSFLRDWYL